MKKLNLKQCTSAIAALIMTLGFIPSLAASEALNLDGINSNYLQQESITFNGSTSNDYTGAITGTLGGVSGFFFCYDLANTISIPGNYQVNPTSPTASFPAYLGLSPTFNLQVASSLLNSLNLSSFTNVNQFTGLQLAIWSVLYNWTSSSQSTNLNGAHFSSTVTGAALTNAQTFLADALALVNSGHYTNTGGWQVLVNANDSPGYVTQTLTGMVTPEPETYLLLGSFLLMAGYCCKRKWGISSSVQNMAKY